MAQDWVACIMRSICWDGWVAVVERWLSLTWWAPVNATRAQLDASFIVPPHFPSTHGKLYYLMSSGFGVVITLRRACDCEHDDKRLPKEIPECLPVHLSSCSLCVFLQNTYSRDVEIKCENNTKQTTTRDRVLRLHEVNKSWEKSQSVTASCMMLLFK